MYFPANRRSSRPLQRCIVPTLTSLTPIATNLEFLSAAAALVKVIAQMRSFTFSLR
nr:MAG TPA: hypothetical protein [Caudoviricetes sp.]